MKLFGVFREDAQPWKKWRRKIKGHWTNPGSSKAWPLNRRV